MQVFVVLVKFVALVILVIYHHDRYEIVLDEYITILILYDIMMSDLQNLRRLDELIFDDMHQQKNSFQKLYHSIDIHHHDSNVSI